MPHENLRRNPRLTPGDLLNLIMGPLEDAGYECRSFSEADLVVQSGATVIHVNFEIFDAPTMAGGAPDDEESDAIPVDSWMMDDGAWELADMPLTLDDADVENSRATDDFCEEISQ